MMPKGGTAMMMAALIGVGDFGDLPRPYGILRPTARKRKPKDRPRNKMQAASRKRNRR